VRFESTTPAFEWAKTVDALDREATVFGLINLGFTIKGRAFFDESLKDSQKGFC
jgi:hypothetical protein